MVSERAWAKVNLALHVTGRRADGYHTLDSLAVFADAADLLTAEAADDLTLSVTGPFGAGLAGEPDNLVLRAARALAEAAGVRARARLVLDKRLPVASGIGGGSADAAAALRALSRLWGLAVPAADLGRVAMSLGADVPVCLDSRPARMRGVGEVLDDVPPLPALSLVLLNPGVAVATPAVFRARAAEFSPALGLPERWRDAAALVAWLGGTRNDLEVAARLLCPPVTDALAALRAMPGCLLARMSGSGATCFGLFAEVPAIGSLPAGWWSSTGLRGTGSGA